MKKNLAILSTPIFLAGLAILLLNDFILKGLYGNFLTGKLSDFAGLFIFPLFWTALFPKHKRSIFWLTALMFIYWKSANSQGLINSWNGLGLFYIDRVIDPSDLIALCMLPLAFEIEERKAGMRMVPVSPILPLMISAFAFAATTQADNRHFEDEEAIYHVKHFSRDSLINDIQKSGLIITYYKQSDDDKYATQHANFTSLTDSLVNLAVDIGDYNAKNGTVELTLVSWSIISTRARPDKETLEKEKAFVRKTFEAEVLRKIEVAF